jgi:hypothetical protein
MRDFIYLVFTSNGIERTTKRPPVLRAGEHAVKVFINAPSNLFQRPIPIKELELVEGNVIRPSVEAEVL